MQRGALIGIIVAVIAVVIIVILAVVVPNNQNDNLADTNSKITLPDSSSSSPSPSPSPTPSNPTASTYTVEITSAGFSPKTLDIKQGDTVVFLNKDTSKHWPASAVHPTHSVYPGSSITKCGTNQQSTIFDACKGLSNGESFSFVFNEKGTWRYHDHLNPSSTGTINVG